MGSKTGSNTQQITHAKGRKTGSRVYLYRKRNIFYYRYVFPKNSVWSIHARELRISLKTGYVGMATRLASRLHAVTLDFLEKSVMSSSDTPSGQKARLEGLRSQLRRLVEELLDEPGKRTISIQDARKKLNGFLKRKLDEDASKPMPLPTSTIIYPDKHIENVSIDSAFEKSANETIRKLILLIILEIGIHNL